MTYNFGFAGGILKYPEDRSTSKFLLFHLISNLPSIPIGEPKTEEKLLFQSLREGHIVDTTKFTTKKTVSTRDAAKYSTEIPYLKIFSLAESFGRQKNFYSFFFLLDSFEQMIVISPLHERDDKNFFAARGRLMTNSEVSSLLGEESVSFSFFKKQAPLPVSILRRVISIGGENETIHPASSKIRMIKF